MATTDITWNGSFVDSTRQVNGRIEIQNSPTAADLKSVAEGGTISALSYTNGIIIATKDIHLMSNSSFENIQNIDLMLREGARITNATSDNSQDNPVTDGQMALTNVRLLFSRTDTGSNAWRLWPFRTYSTQAYSNWAKCHGGSFTSINPLSTANGIRLGFSEISNYRIASNSYSPNIQQVVFRNTQSAYNLELGNVDRLVVEARANCFLENIDHSNATEKAILITRYASCILNGWNTNDNNTGVRHYVHQGVDVPRDHYIYFLGSASEHFPSQYSDITVTSDSSNYSRRAHWHKGGMRYYQVYKDGLPFPDFRVGVYRNTTEQKSRPILTNSSMLETQAVNTSHTDGKISFVVVSQTIEHNGSSWETQTHNNLSFKIRAPSIIFQKINLTQSQANESIGSRGSHAPYVVETDPNFTNEGVGSAVLGINQSQRRLEFFGNGTLQNFYNHIKNNFATAMTDDIEIGRNGTWLTTDYDADLTANATITPTARFKGIWLTRNNSRFSNLVTAKAIALRDNIALRSDHDGIGLIVKSNITGTKFAFSNSADTSNPSHHTTPTMIFLQPGQSYKITAKAPGHIYQKYDIDADTTTGVLDMRLPEDPNIELTAFHSQSEYDKINISALTSDVIEFRVTGELDLHSQREKTKTLLDEKMSENIALTWLHDNLTNPLIKFLADRILIETESMEWYKTTTPDVFARIGVPLYDIHNFERYYAERSATNGIVQFDSLQLIGIVEDEKINAITTDIASVKAQTDKMQFASNNDIKSTLDGELDTFTTHITNSLDLKLNATITSRLAATEVDTINAIKERTDKLYFEAETKTGTQDKVQTYTTVQIGDTPVTIDLSTIEDGLEQIIEQLTEQLDEDDNETLLGIIKNTRDFQQGTIEIDDSRIVYKDVDGNVIKSFTRRTPPTKADYSGGRNIESDSS